ncbi:uncharacterized protein LOC120275624 [Dioscorea cayenensis subsp. rotundata]|uniref:Uncharacterized protein LOC120275624 n=1 Tax=Dioscorea cayennensis subsp. rotundata TaxID=55577 RepID=A0AB40CHS6_DIOCR|nr:uncharacterized protein LOC120275624 [Dioscorea cayenensis subsp. rotundata]
MAVNWEIHHEGDEPPEDYVEDSARVRTDVEVEGDPGRVGRDGDADSEYADLVPIRPRYAEFNEEVDMKTPQFNAEFRSFKQFEEAVKNCFVMNFKPNNKRKCKAFYKNGCPFYLWASPMVNDRNIVQIKPGYLDHECSRDHLNRHVNADWITLNYLEQFRADPAWKIVEIIQAIKSNQEVDISRLKTYRAKCIANSLIDGDEVSQMKRLNDYRLELLKTHPGLTIIVKCTNEGVFQSLYVCLAPFRAGFLAGCRYLLSLDDCFLKGLYGGQLLTAVGIDANDCIYPIDWALVNKENKENWKEFL